MMKTKLGEHMLCHAPTLDDALARLRDKKVKGKKPRVGIYGLTGCAGCQLTILFAQERFLGFLDMVDVVALPFIKEKNDKGRLDIILLEGMVASKGDKKRALELREKCDLLVTIGACAVHGCIPAMKEFMNHPEVERAAYAKVDFLKKIDASPVSSHVNVDYELPGCPPDAEQIFQVLTDLTLGRPPRIVENPVCVECSKRGVDCLLRQGKECLGPITTGGCHAVCTVAGHECVGCRGPTRDANIPAFINLLEKKGYERADIEARLHTYANMAVTKAEAAQGVTPVRPKKKTTAKKKRVKRRTTKKTVKKKAKRKPVKRQTTKQTKKQKVKG